MLDLQAIFGNNTVPTVAAVVVVESTAQPEAVDPAIGATDAEIAPGDLCPVCGSLEKWWDILGGEHCQQCERAILEKALGLADRAARLRAAQPTKPEKAAA